MKFVRRRHCTWCHRSRRCRPATWKEWRDWKLSFLCKKCATWWALQRLKAEWTMRKVALELARRLNPLAVTTSSKPIQIDQGDTVTT